MIFECPNCLGDCPIPDERIRNRILKIRCKQCRHAFYVRDPAMDEHLDERRPAPPAPDEDDVWFYALNQESHGPVSTGVMRHLIESAQVLSSTLVWREIMEEWLPLGKVDELAAILQEIASPPPPEGPEPIAPGLEEIEGAAPDPLELAAEAVEEDIAVDLDQEGEAAPDIALVEKRREEKEDRLKAEEEEEELEKAAEAESKAEKKARKKAELKARFKEEEKDRLKAEEEELEKAAEAERKAEKKARKKAELKARFKEEEKDRLKAEEEELEKAVEAERRAEEEAKLKAEEEARKTAQPAVRRAAPVAEAVVPPSAAPQRKRFTQAMAAIPPPPKEEPKPTEKPFPAVKVSAAVLVLIFVGVGLALAFSGGSGNGAAQHAEKLSEAGDNLFGAPSEMKIYPPPSKENPEAKAEPDEGEVENAMAMLDEELEQQPDDKKKPGYKKSKKKSGSKSVGKKANGNSKKKRGKKPEKEKKDLSTEAMAMPSIALLDLSGGDRLPRSISQDQIKEVVNRNRVRIQFCYETQLRRNPNLSGKLVVTFSIKGSGNVSTVKISTSKFKGSYLEECVKEAVSRWRFPRFAGDSVDVDYPFVFASY